MISSLLAKIIGTANARQLARLNPIVQKINSLEPRIEALSNDELTQQTNKFRQQLTDGKTLDDILPEAFATVRETARRVLGQRHFDVQLLGGMVLHQGKISEMKTGEGKTLTATLPLYLNALTGKGVHLVTVNDYLARRDAEWMRPVYERLGLSVGILQNDMNDMERKAAYNSDILYATNNELGFDYLRDNMKFRLEDYVQRDLSYAIVDEVDSILIDEARTPLIISGSANEATNLYAETSKAVERLVAKEDYEVDIKARTVQLTESGNDKLERVFGVKNLYAIENLNLLHHITQALRAHVIFKRDVDYVVRDNQVLIVDEFTGRILSGRRYSDGLHQSLEAKEGVKIERESQTLASITLQNYFRLYKKLAGMTGTAQTEAEEFHNIYKLDAVSIPTNRKPARADKSDIIFLTERSKFRYIVEDIKERYKQGQPVLIGTIAVETSERLSHELTRAQIPHEVLNAKQHAREAEIVAKAGEPGHITIATNMAGRGTDIKLTPDSVKAGGLYILGTERHESRRIDNQLRGRSGRQGDPGESRFYISLEDDLIRRFAGDTIKNRMERYGGMTEDELIESKAISKMIENAQEKVEKQNFEVRKNLIEYDDVLNQHRTIVYQYRREVLEGEDQIYGLVRDFIASAAQALVARVCDGQRLTAQHQEDIYTFLSRLTTIDVAAIKEEKFGTANSDAFENDIINWLLVKYELYRNRYDQSEVQNAEKWLLLETIDQAWKQHMLNLDHLKEGIHLRSWGQKNPLIEYKKEAYAMFEDMMQQIRFEVVHHIFNMNVERFDDTALELKREQELNEMHMVSGGEDTERKPVQRDEPKIGRNDDCSCGSGRKYKKCCGK